MVRKFSILGLIGLFAVSGVSTVHAQWDDSMEEEQSFSVDCTDCEEPISHCLMAGVELTYFRLHGNQGAGGNSNVGNVDDYFPGYGFETAGRYWLGVQTDSGLGIRGRYFNWSESTSYLGLTRTQAIETWDIEGTYATRFSTFDLTFFGGFRHADIGLDGSDFGEPNPYNFSGDGLTLGADLRKPLGYGFAIIGGGRFSALYGDTNFRPISNQELDNTFVDIWEGRLGLEWSRETGCGLIAVSGAWEHQVYGTETYLPFAIDPETLGDVSLAGPVFALRFEY